MDCGRQVSQCHRGTVQIIKKARLIGDMSKKADYQVPILYPKPPLPK